MRLLGIVSLALCSNKAPAVHCTALHSSGVMGVQVHITALILCKVLSTAPGT